MRKRRLGDGDRHKVPFHGWGRGSSSAPADGGIALIITLWVTLIVSVIAITFAYEARTDMYMMGYSTQSIQARYLARAGMSRAMILLREDILKDQDVLEREYLVELDDKDVGYLYDAFNEEWYSGVDGSYDEVEVESGISRDSVIGTYSVKVIDESSKVNLNSRSTTQDLIQQLLIACGVEDEEEAQAQAAAIIDWRDKDDQPSDGGDAREFGDELTEDTYYNPEQDSRDIEEFGAEYICKNAPYGTPEELLLVKWMTPELFFGEDLNGNGELDRNEDDGDETFPPDNEDGVLQLGLRHYVTVDSEGPININTAGEPVLRALLGLAVDEKKTQRLAERIVDYRLGPDGRAGTRDDEALRTIDGSYEIGNSLSDISGFDPEILTAIQNILTVKSDTFTIVSTGSVQGARWVLRATVFREFREKTEVEEDEERGPRRRGARTRRDRRYRSFEDSEWEGRDPRQKDQGRIYIVHYTEARVYGEPVAEGREKRRG